MNEELLFLTTAEDQVDSDQETGVMNVESKPSVADKIISGRVDVDSLKNTIRTLSDALNSNDINEGAFVIEELVVSLGINGSGEVGIIGTGAKMGAEASIKVTLKRNKDGKKE